jgi:glycosyltransferase involved in cell wall biosynthesis
MDEHDLKVVIPQTEKRWVILAGEEAGPPSNKLGGIWEVIDQEAATMARLLDTGEINDNTSVLVAGPYYPIKGSDWNTAKDRTTDISTFEPLEFSEELEEAIKKVESTGAVVKTCSRTVGNTTIGYVLFDTSGYNSTVVKFDGQRMRLSDAIKTEAHELVGLDSVSYENEPYGHEYTHYLNLSYSVSQLAESLLYSGLVSLHCHEYGVFYSAARLEKLKKPIKSVATFHATKVGRGWGSRVMEKIKKNDGTWGPFTPEGLAKLEALSKYLGAITFVGDTTRHEAKLFYGVDGTVIRNGITVERDTIDWDKKEASRKKLQEFISTNLHESYGGEKILPKNILPIFTISRLELENKGYPDLMDSLIILDRAYRNHVINGTIDEDVRIVCIMITAHGQKDVKRLQKGFPIFLPEETLVGDERVLKSMIIERDLHMKHLLTSRRIVGSILYPQWVKKDDGGFGMTVDEIAAGCIASIFPSRYEPFLLTGLEAGKEGTPVVISRTCGFSDAVIEYKARRGLAGGVVSVDNIKLPYLEVIADYAMGLESITNTYMRDRGKYKMMCLESFNLASHMGWEGPVKKYYEILAHG